MMPDDFAPSIRELLLTTLNEDRGRPVLLVSSSFILYVACLCVPVL